MKLKKDQDLSGDDSSSETSQIDESPFDEETPGTIVSQTADFDML